jgi:hypothetical protein
MHSTTSTADDRQREVEAPATGVAGEQDKADTAVAPLAIAISELQRALDRLADGSGRRHDDAVRYARGELVAVP